MKLDRSDAIARRRATDGVAEEEPTRGPEMNFIAGERSIDANCPEFGFVEIDIDIS